MKCKQCGKEILQTSKREKYYCSDKCRKAFKRSITDKTTPITDKSISDKSITDKMVFTKNGPKKFIPNWTKDYKTKKEALEAIIYQMAGQGHDVIMNGKHYYANKISKMNIC